MRKYSLYIVTNGSAFRLKQNFDDAQEAVTNADYVAANLMMGQYVEVWLNIKGSKNAWYVAHGSK